MAARVGHSWRRCEASAAARGFAAGIVVLPPREQVVGLYPDSEYQKRVGRDRRSSWAFFVIDPLPALKARAGHEGIAVHSLRSESSLSGGPSGDRAGDHGILQPAQDIVSVSDTPGAARASAVAVMSKGPKNPERSFGISVGGVLIVIALALWWRGRVGRAEILARNRQRAAVLRPGAAAAAQVAERGLVEILPRARLRQRQNSADAACSRCCWCRCRCCGA